MVIADSPVLIIGLPRSGSSLLAEMIKTGGVWWGDWHERPYDGPIYRNHEDEAVRMLAEEMSEFAGGRPKGIEPFPFENLPELLSREAVNLFLPKLEALDADMSSASPDGRWGAKFCAITWTLPLWLYAFPTAKVVYSYRDPLSTAASWQKKGGVSDAEAGLRLCLKYAYFVEHLRPPDMFTVHYEKWFGWKARLQGEALFDYLGLSHDRLDKSLALCDSSKMTVQTII